MSHIISEAENKELDMFYSVEPQWKDYLCNETADAFVLPLLLRAVVSNQDIKIDAPLSEKLYHNLQYGVLYALSYARMTTPKVFGLTAPPERIPQINITCRELATYKYSATGVGTGCSLGVDSFSVIKKYFLDEDCLPEYKISHFACFNVGAFGSYSTEKTHASFIRQVDRLKEFAEFFKLPVVSVDTNLHDLFPEQNFDWCHSFLNMGCVLSLQKLWGKYLYASSVPISKFEFSFGYSGHYEPFLLPNLSTESTELVAADIEKPRSEKVRYIMDDAIVKHNLNVCIREQSINNGLIKRNDTSEVRLNCGHCEKCLRTMLQLDIYGRLYEYSSIFNLSDWPVMKNDYLAKVLAGKNHNYMYNDIVSTIVAYNYPIPTKVLLLSFLLRIKQFIKSVVRR